MLGFQPWISIPWMALVAVLLGTYLILIGYLLIRARNGTLVDDAADSVSDTMIFLECACQRITALLCSCEHAGVECQTENSFDWQTHFQLIAEAIHPLSNGQKARALDAIRLVFSDELQRISAGRASHSPEEFFVEAEKAVLDRCYSNFSSDLEADHFAVSVLEGFEKLLFHIRNLTAA